MAAVVAMDASEQCSIPPIGATPHLPAAGFGGDGEVDTWVESVLPVRGPIPSALALGRPGNAGRVDEVEMRVCLGSDERTALTDAVEGLLRARGLDVDLIGTPAGDPYEWADVGRRVGERVADGTCAQGFLFCWTGTGAAIAANKVPGVRAALCTDAPTASGARKWNDANVLVLSNRLVSPAVAEEILDAWFAAEPDASEAANIAKLG